MERRIEEKITKEFCKGNEIWLDYIPQVKESNKILKGVDLMSIGMDLGSTATRSRVFVIPEDGGEPIIEPEKSVNSSILKVTDISTVRSKNLSLYNNIEITLRDITDDKVKAVKIFTSEHFVKGSLAREVVGVELPRPSKISKTKLVATYLNIITSAALEILYSQEGKEMDKACYHINLAVTLPPQDFDSNKTTESFLANLAGHYEISFDRLGIKFNLKFREKDIFLDKEPNAVQCALVLSKEGMEDLTSIGIDGGGKSTDFNFLNQGIIQDDLAITGEYGGNKLIDNIIKAYVKKTGNTRPPKEAVLDALDRGLLNRGGRIEDIFEEIKEVKLQMSQTTFNDTTRISDSADMGLDDVDLLTFHGGLFRNTTNEMGEVANIGMYLMELIKSSVSNVPKSLFVEEDSLISLGIIYSYWASRI